MRRSRRAPVAAGLVALGLVGGSLTAAAAPPAVAATVPAVVEPAFSDIGPGDAFYDDVTWLAGQGITTGWADGTFRPTAPVTREATAAFMARWVESFSGEVIPPCAGDVERTFGDVGAGNPFCGAIEWLSGFAMYGYPDGTFRPAANVTREAFAAVLMRGYWVEPECDPATPRTFTDVGAGHPFCGYIETAAEWGLVTGWPDGTFRPGLEIERQAIAAMIHRADIMQDEETLAGTWQGQD